MTIAKRSVLGLFLAMAMAGCGGDDDDPPMIDAASNIDAPGGGPTVFTVPLTTAEEVPVCAMAGAAATGSATITISEDETTIMAEVTYSGLSSAASAAHIHAGGAGQMGPPIFPFSAVASPISQTFTAADYPNPPPADAPADFAAAVTAMKNGETYINVHTAACAPGEIRAQIE